MDSDTKTSPTHDEWEAQESARALLDFSPIGISLWASTHKVIDCNQAFLFMFGVASKSDVIRCFHEFSPEFQPDGSTSRKRSVAVIGAAFETGYQKFEWMHRTASGEPLPTEVTLVRFPWQGGWRVAAYTHDLRAHAAHLEAEERARVLLDATPLGVSMWDSELNILDCNPAFLRMFSLSEKSDAPRRFHSLYPVFQPNGSVSRDEAFAHIRAAFESGYRKAEWMHCTASGEPLPTEVTLVRLPWRGGWRVAAYTRDLREREARREAEEHARVLLDSSPIGAALWDPEGNFLDCNQALLRMVGLNDKGDLIRRYAEMMPEFQPDGTASAEKMVVLVRAAFETGYQQCVWLHRTASGAVFPTEKILIRTPWRGGWRVAAYTRDLREHAARLEAEERGRILLDASPVGAVLWDAKGNVLACNQESLRMFGLADKAEYMTRFDEFNPIFQPDGTVSRRQREEYLRAAFETGYQKYEWMHRAPSGAEFPTGKILIRLPWQGGWCVAAYTRDLREYAARLEAEERGRILLDASPVGAVLWDENSNILDCNQAFVRMFGIADKDEFIHRFAEMMPEFQPDGAASGDAWAANLRATFATGYQKFEWMHLTASGETLPTEKTQFRIPWKGGWCVASYTYDLRERMARREAEEQARVFLDAIPQGAVLFDMEHNIIDCNQTALRMFGLADRAEYMARYHELDPEFQPDGAPSREKAAAFIRAAFETGSQEYEWMHCTSSGDPLPTEMYLIRIPWKGAWCVAACIRDLRDRMALREAEERAQSLEVISKAAEMASHAKSEFLAKMSHELRTPLNAVIGFLGLELQKRLPRETAANLEISLDACHNLLYLIDDILDISKIETDHFDLTRDNYRLVGFIDDIVRLNRFRLESKHIHCRLDIDENLPSWLYGDDLRIKQVINNLLSNAFKYTEQGTITLGIGLAPEEETQAGSVSIRFSVRDTGQGIAAGNIEKLFTSYTRFDSKANRLIEGTGLGLAICKGLVEKMGGRMEVDSEYGKGSVFSCVIPQLVIDPTPIGKVAVRELTFPRSTSRRGETTRRPPWRCSPMPYARVLVVDDVPTNLAVARSMLLRYGMTVDCVAGGREAIERIRSGQPRYDAVFMDHMMPGMDGIEALRWIRGINSDYARSVPVIILTANVVAGNEKKFLDLGFQAFLAKPIDPMKLDGVLNRWVKNALREAGLTAVHTEQSEQDTAPCGDQDVGASLIHIDGLDMEEAISRFGSEEAYLDVLRSYAVNTPQLLEQMRRLSDTDLSDCALLAHGMKGASYGVGAKALGDMAEKLERWGTRKHGRKVRQALPLFFEAAEKLLHDIGALLAALGPDSGAEEDKPLKAAPDPGELAALYKASLSCSHSAMEERLRTLEQYRYQADGELVVWLRARVDALDYDQINERLAEYAA